MNTYDLVRDSLKLEELEVLELLNKWLPVGGCLVSFIDAGERNDFGLPIVTEHAIGAINFVMPGCWNMGLPGKIFHRLDAIKHVVADTFVGEEVQNWKIKLARAGRQDGRAYIEIQFLDDITQEPVREPVTLVLRGFMVMSWNEKMKSWSY